MPPSKVDHFERRLQEERDVAEILTCQLKVQQCAVRVELESQASQRKEQLAQAQKQLREQREAAEGLIRQMMIERDESPEQLSEAAAGNRKLQEELTVTQEQFRQQRETTVKTTRKITERMEAAGTLIIKLVAERDESRSQLSESEAKAHSLEGQLETVAHQLKAEQDESRTQLSGVASHLQNLEEPLVLAQRQFQDQRAAVTRMIQQRAVD